MTDDERLKNAGWSPNSLRLAMADMDSPADWSKDTKCASDSTTIESRFGLKRSTNPHIGTPNTVTRRDSKVTDLKQTPNFRSGRSSPIDLSISTVKKGHGSVNFSDELYSKDFDRDDDLFVLTQTFRRQSITTNDTKKSSRFVNRSAHPVDENRNPSSANLSVDANGPTLRTKSTTFAFDITSPVNHKSISIERICKMKDSPKALNFDRGSKTDTSSHVSPNAEVMPITAKPPGSQMEKLLLAANLESTLPNGWKLFKHQKEAITECLRLGRSIMAFDMGLGKTLISLIWAKAVCSQCADCITVIIVPCTLTEVWKREAEMIGFISIDVNRKHAKKSRILADHVEAPRIFVSSWSKIPSASQVGQKYVLIADEAHAMQSTASIRTKSALNLCLHANCFGLILSTGTPMKNGRPSNILPLLQGIKHPVAQNKIEFEKKYCNGRKTKFCAWDVSGASNLEELKCAIGPYLMRKTKEECLDLPSMTRRTVKIKIPCNVLAEYNQIIQKMKIKMKSSYARNGGEGRNGPGGNSSCLEMMSQLRIFSSKSKVNGSAALLRKMLVECSDPIVVFVWYKETSSMLQAALLDHVDNEDSDSSEPTEGSDTSHIRCECLTGDIVKHQNPFSDSMHRNTLLYYQLKMRQDMVDRFQLGEIDVLICTYGVGSTGLTLTRSHTVMLLDRPWTPGDTAQAEDRVRRIGQLSNKVESIWIEAFDLDIKLDQMLDNKAKNTARVVSSSIPDKVNSKNVSEKVPQMRAAQAPLKTLDDYFSSRSSESTSAVFEDDTDISWAVEKETICHNDKESADKNQMSIIGTVFKQLMAS